MRIVSLKKLFIISTIGLLSFSSFAQTKPLYKLPETLPDRSTSSVELPYIIGNDSGIFRVLPSGALLSLWREGKVTQILRTEYSDSNDVRGSKWFFVTSKGIISSTDLTEFVPCNDGLPSLTIKTYDGENKALVQQTPLLKDLSADPFDQNILVTATKDNVYLSRNSGLSWKSISSMSKNTAGIKAVAVTHIDSKLVVFMSHPIYGLSYYCPDDTNPKWTDITKGFQNMATVSYPDEISDIVPVVCKRDDGTVYSEIFVSQTYLPNIYRLNWAEKKAECVYTDKEPLMTIDSLCQSGSSLIFACTGEVRQLSLDDYSVTDMPENFNAVRKDFQFKSMNAAFIPQEKTGLSTSLQLNELWLVKPNISLAKYGTKALDKKAIYIPANHVTDLNGINKYKKIIKDNKLNALVVDMKDDYGLLRFDPKSDVVKEKCYVSRYKINIEEFVQEFKKDDIYLVARIVVFKDKNLANYDKKQYAVWNWKTNTSWDGIKGTEDVVDEEGNITGKQTVYYDEKWVDPYCEQVWEYNVSIAKDLIEYGFDEIQFDYIRFPTDGINMNQASFRWKDEGMDKESAIMSFLSYARQNINAPIGIDIYGANGWYRTGARTGQDVELLSEYVDVICPMFYPSHFEQSFLNYKPFEERPYRIYYYGTYRNTVLGRNHIIVRPWVQAFYLGVSYDRQFYNTDYVKREVFGVRDSVNRGYMYWNNIGRYDDISPDPSAEDKYPWTSFEASKDFRKPAFSFEEEEYEVADTLASQDEVTAILDSVLYKEIEENPGRKRSGLFLHVNSLWEN